ncbi:phosducin-like protein [Anoplophora glabripennis]|nr:phosducin-like protein [Anoplophora glabripennis]
MATLEDKILGEKLHNYCSSSEESDNENSNSDSEEANKQKGATPGTTSPPEINKWEGTSTNTGPKGVIKDWQRYKQLENEKREEDERERIELMKKLTLSVQSALDEEREKAALEDPDLAELLSDEFLVKYQKQRMQEMLQQTNHNIKFGDLIFLKNGQEYLDAIDKEHKSVMIIIHIYEDNVEACRAMNACLKVLCKIYENVKFCAIHGSKAGISRQFKTDGVPALLVYKSGNLVGNFVRLSDDLGNDFQPEDVQGHLVEHGLLEDKSCTPVLIKGASSGSDSD